MLAATFDADRMPSASPPSAPAAASSVPVTRRQVALLLVAIVLVSLNLRSILTIIGPLISDIRADTGLSRTAAGLLTTLPLLAFGLVSPLAPRIARRFGSDRTLIGAMLLMAVALALRPLPPLALLLLGTLAAGCGAAVANVLLPAIIKNRLPGQAAVMVGAYSVVLGIGAALAAGLAVPTMHWLDDSWRAALALWAIPALLGAIAWLPLLRGSAQRRAAAAAQHVHVSLWRDRLAWTVTGYLAFLALQFYSLAAWLPDVYREEGMSAASAGGVLSIALAVGLPLGFVVGVVAQRLDDQRPIALVAVLVIASGWLGVLLAPMAAPWLWAALLGCGFGTGFPLVLVLMVLRAPDVGHAAELSGMSQSAGYGVGALAPDHRRRPARPVRGLDAAARRAARLRGADARARAGGEPAGVRGRRIRRARGARAGRRRRSRRVARLSAMPARLPDGEPAPRDGALPAAALAGLGDANRPFGVYVHVPFCATRCGYCDFNTYTAAERRRRLARGLRRRRARRAGARAARARRRRAPRRDGLLRRRHADAAAAGRAGARSCGAIDETFGLAPGAEVTTEANPESVDPRVAERAARGGLHARLARDAERGAARARDARPRPHAGARGGGRARGARGRLRARQPRPDLRHAGRDRRRLARLARRRARAPSRTTSARTR